MSAKRPPGARRRGRSWIAAVLLGFVVVATAVIWRRGYGVTRGAEIRTLTRQRNELRAERASLERHIAELTGRARLEGIAERQLDMHVPADSQVIVMPAAALTPAAEGKRAAP